jgi:DnaJ family protein B protein 12
VNEETIRRIRSSIDYYEILGVARNADDHQLKRAYRKLALYLHPDKNGSDGAMDAFKAVSSAFAVLGDATKRRNYDRRKTTARTTSPTSGHNTTPTGRHANKSRDDSSDDTSDDGSSYHSDISAEELFNMFFGTSSKYNENIHVHRAHHRQADGDR